MSTRSDRKPGVEALARRVLELERTVQLLEEARSHYADQYNFAPCGCVTFDGRGCVLELNVTAARLLGKERAQIVGMPLLHYLDREQFPVFMHHLRSCRNSHQKVVTHIAIQTVGGARQVELLSVPVPHPESEETVYRTALFDITERQRAEQALRRSEERFATAFRASANPITISTLSDGRFIDVNPSFCQLLESERETVVGHTSIELGYVRDTADRIRSLRKFRRRGVIRDLEMRVWTSTGQPRDVIVSAERVTLETGECILAIWQDVTDLRRLQREVLDVAEREKARIGEDLHDGVCQNLVGVAYMAEALARELKKVQPASAAGVRDVARVVRESIEDLRRLAAGLFPVKLERYGLAWALRTLAEETTARSRVNCRFVMRRPIRVSDRGTAVHLYRIAQEALGNSIRHGRSQNVELRLTAGAGKLWLRIRDDGSGMPRRTRTPGLGLHSMQYRAKMIGGTLRIVSGANRGTSVTCALPDTGVSYDDGSQREQEEDLPR